MMLIGKLSPLNKCNCFECGDIKKKLRDFNNDVSRGNNI